MRALIILALLAAPAFAAVSLDDLVTLILKKGKEKPISNSIVQKLGFPGPMSSRAAALRTPDGSVHALYVVYKDDTPLALVWAKAKTVDPATKSIDALDIRTDMKGTVESAVKTTGVPGELTETAVPVKSVAAEYAAEKKLLLNQLPSKIK